MAIIIIGQLGSVELGDFERTFGAGADVEAIISGFSREFEDDDGSRSKRKRTQSGELFAKLESGLRLVTLASVEEFYAEAVAIEADDRADESDDNTFNDKVVEGSLYLALRNSYDHTCAVIHVVRDHVWHILGLSKTHHGLPISDILFSAFRARGWKIGLEFATYGWLSDGTGKWHSVENLPARFTVSNSLNLRGTSISALPKQVTVSGDLCLANTGIDSLPERLTVGGNLDLSGTKVIRLPDRMTVGGDLSLEKTALKHFPVGLTAGGMIFVGSWRVVLPAHDSITDNFDRYELRWPPSPSVTVGGSVYFDEAALLILPKGSTVIDGDMLRSDNAADKVPVGINYMTFGTRVIAEIVPGDKVRADAAKQKKILDDFGWGQTD